MNKASIFKKGSTTYFYSSIFFPPKVRDMVFTLYAFVRTADDYVDTVPQKVKEFKQFYKDFETSWEGEPSKNEIIDEFVALAKDIGITRQEIIAFLNAMASDIGLVEYKSYESLQKYMYGSAGVIGIMMCKIMNLPKEAYPAAKLQGEAMQLINFIRDVWEDFDLGRIYLPKDDMKKYNVIPAPPQSVQQQKSWEALLRFEIDRYESIQIKAEEGYHFIPRRYRIPIMTAAERYNWTARKIYMQPLLVFKQKVKPKPIAVIGSFIRNFFKA